jgi:hypothetical protein
MPSRQKQRKLDKALSDSFPASDPVSSAEPGAPERPQPSPRKGGMDHIDAGDEQELRFWAKELGVDVERIRQAVAAVGPDVEKVRQHLKASPGS